jgi:hypothetical protein
VQNREGHVTLHVLELFGQAGCWDHGVEVMFLSIFGV